MNMIVKTWKKYINVKTNAIFLFIVLRGVLF